MQIRAPFDGTRGCATGLARCARDVLGSAGSLDAIDPPGLVFTIPESVLQLARIGAPFSLDVAAYPGASLRRRDPLHRAERRLGDAAHPDQGQRPESRRRAAAGHVRARRGDDSPSALPCWCPEEAIVTSDAEGTFVWRIGAEDKAERVAVELGAREPGRVEMRVGFAARAIAS